MYLVDVSRPDIAFAVGVLSRNLESPTFDHHVAAKRVWRYLKGTAATSLVFPTTGEPKITVYSDADWANDENDRKSISGYIIFFGSSPLIWKSKKQPSIATSTTEADWMSAYYGACDSLWLRGILREIGYPSGLSPVHLGIDNQAALALMSGQRTFTKLKHISVKYLWLRELTLRGDLKTFYVRTSEQPADGLTKCLPTSEFRTFRSRLGIEIHLESSPLRS